MRRFSCWWSLLGALQNSHLLLQRRTPSQNGLCSNRDPFYGKDCQSLYDVWVRRPGFEMFKWKTSSCNKYLCSLWSGHRLKKYRGFIDVINFWAPELQGPVHALTLVCLVGLKRSFWPQRDCVCVYNTPLFLQLCCEITTTAPFVKHLVIEKEETEFGSWVPGVALHLQDAVDWRLQCGAQKQQRKPLGKNGRTQSTAAASYNRITDTSTENLSCSYCHPHSSMWKEYLCFYLQIMPWPFAPAFHWKHCTSGTSSPALFCLKKH